MRPDYGIDILDYIFESDSQSMRSGIEREVKSAVARWEPRVAIDGILVEGNEKTEPGELLITVYYTILQTGTSSSITIGV